MTWKVCHFFLYKQCREEHQSSFFWRKNIMCPTNSLKKRKRTIETWETRKRIVRGFFRGRLTATAFPVHVRRLDWVAEPHSVPNDGMSWKRILDVNGTHGRRQYRRWARKTSTSEESEDAAHGAGGVNKKSCHGIVTAPWRRDHEALLIDGFLLLRSVFCFMSLLCVYCVTVSIIMIIRMIDA